MRVQASSRGRRRGPGGVPQRSPYRGPQAVGGGVVRHEWKVYVEDVREALDSVSKRERPAPKRQRLAR
jgi:hypothetical protein